MTLFGKDIPDPIHHLQTGINKLFDQVWHSGIRTGPFDGQDWAPPLDVIEKVDRYVVELELAGINREDVEVSCTSSQLTVKGHKVHSAEGDESDHVVVSERRYGGFCRVITFADAVRADDMTAKLDNGVLRVHAPKKTRSSTREIKVQISD